MSDIYYHLKYAIWIDTENLLALTLYILVYLVVKIHLIQTQYTEQRQMSQ